MRPPGGVCFRLLSSRLPTTCRIRSTSAITVRSDGPATETSTPFSSATYWYKSATSARSETTSTGCRCSFITPVSASEISIRVLSMVMIRSDSSAQSSRASRKTSTVLSDCNAVSIPARRRVTGVRRSWATLSRAARMPVSSSSIFSSMVLKRRTSSSSSSPLCRDGTLASILPVSMLRTTWIRSRTGRRERKARKNPPAKPKSINGAMIAAKILPK